MFPFGIQPEASDPSRDERGPDTMNRLLLHGARYHDRTAVFVSATGEETADWQADRRSLRIALALQRNHGVGPGDRVALWMPLSLDFALVERAVWGLGTSTLPLLPAMSLLEAGRILEEAQPKLIVTDRSRGATALPLPVVTLVGPSGSVARLVEDGGALDTAERASQYRALARGASPSLVASIESNGSEMTQASWVARVRHFLERHPPKRKERHVLLSARPGVPERIVVHAGWADGLTTVILGSDDEIPSTRDDDVLFSRGARTGTVKGRSVTLSADGGTDV
jgi:AMP-binding enzyme